MLPVAPPSRLLGVLCAAVVVGLTTALVFPLRTVAPVVSLGVVYLVAVLLISTVWGAWLGVLTAIASALAFNYFHIPPTGRFTIAESENWVALVVFLIVAVIGSSVGQVARARATEADQRRREADLAAEMARLLLRGNVLAESLPAAAQRLASALSLPSAEIELAPVEGDERRVAFPLREGTTQLGTLLVPAGLPEQTLRRLQERVVPSLEALLAAGLDRDRLLGEVVETRALRRADVVKTTLLRAVSHDLRTPLTAIVAAGEAIASPTLTDAERRELGSVITAESTRLSRLIDNLLDLSRLEGGAADPRPEWCSIEEVIGAALDDLRLAPKRFSLVARPRPPARARGRRPARARVREPARERRPLLGRAAGLGPRPRDGRADARSGRRPRARDPARAARPRVRALLPRRQRERRPSRLGPRAGDRARVRGGQRRPGLGRVAPGPGDELRGRVPGRAARDGPPARRVGRD